MRKPLPLVLVSLVVLCACAVTSDYVVINTAEQTGCREDEITIREVPDADMTSSFVWRAECRGQEYTCEHQVIGDVWWTGIAARIVRCAVSGTTTQAAQQAAVDRLRLETGCAAARIRLVDSSQSSGGERAFRLEACGRPYVCSTTANGTDCEPAEGAPPPATAPRW